MFYSIVDLVEQASTQYQGNVAELMIATEFELTGRERGYHGLKQLGKCSYRHINPHEKSG